MNAEVTRRADVLFGGAKVRTQTDDLNKPRPMKSFKELQQQKSGVEQMVERNMAARRNVFENKRKKVREREQREALEVRNRWKNRQKTTPGGEENVPPATRNAETKSSPPVTLPGGQRSNKSKRSPLSRVQTLAGNDRTTTTTTSSTLLSSPSNRRPKTAGEQRTPTSRSGRAAGTGTTAGSGDGHSDSDDGGGGVQETEKEKMMKKRSARPKTAASRAETFIHRPSARRLGYLHVEKEAERKVVGKFFNPEVADKENGAGCGGRVRRKAAAVIASCEFINKTDKLNNFHAPRPCIHSAILRCAPAQVRGAAGEMARSTEGNVRVYVFVCAACLCLFGGFLVGCATLTHTKLFKAHALTPIHVLRTQRIHIPTTHLITYSSLHDIAPPHILSQSTYNLTL